MSDLGAVLERWGSEAGGLHWGRPFEAVYEPDGAAGRWFVGGELNAAVNCLDRHLPSRGDRIALYWEG